MAGVWILTVSTVLSACWIQVIRGTCPLGQFGDSCTYPCHCGDSCDQTTGVCGGDCDVGWVGGAGTNCQKDKGVDGNRDQRTRSGSCFNSADNTWSLWTVDLGQQYRLHDVRIYHPLQSPGRILPIVLYLSNTNTSLGVPCYTFPSDTDVTGNSIYDVICDGRGRYFTITNTTYLNLCEVEIYVCSPRLYGQNCNQSCHCAEEVCHPVIGVCPGDCRPGWQGYRCDTECDADHYGVNCVNICSDRMCSDVNSSCDRYIGSCDTACLAGWRGVDCTKECNNGTYGQNCSETCSERKCAGDSSCDLAIGKCISGCVSGWMGEDCKKACDSQHYGPNCIKTCASRHCEGNSPCNSTGDCGRGCETRWTLDDCTACLTGYFGAECKEECGLCAGHKTCNSSSGECPSGCVEGYMGPQCKASSPQQNNPDRGEEILIPAVIVTTIVVSVPAAVAVGVVIWRKRRRPSLQESDSHDYYNTSHLAKVPTKQSRDNDETQLEARTYDGLSVMSREIQGPEETYCTLNTEKPDLERGASGEVAETTDRDIYEPTEPRTYETLDSTSRDVIGVYSELGKIT